MILQGSAESVFYLLIVLGLSVAVLYRSFFGVLALTVAIPLRTVLPTILGFEFTWIVGFITGLGLFKKLIIQREYSSTPLDLPILILTVAHAASMIPASLNDFSIQNYLSVGVAYAAYFLVTNVVQSKRECRMLVNALLVVGMFHMAITVYFLIFGQMPFFVPIERLNRVANAGSAGRFWGTMGSTSSFSMFFVMMVPLLAVQLISARSRLRAVVYASVIVGFILSLGATLTRSALLGLVIVCIIFGTGAVSEGAVSKKVAFGGTLSSLIPAGAALLITGYLESLWRRFINQESFWGGRLDRFYHAIEVGISHPMGAGRGTSLVTALAQAGATNPKKVHNVVLGLFAQTGYVGLVGILWFIIAQVRTNISVLTSGIDSRQDHLLLLAMISGILGYWSMAMFFFKHDWGFLFIYFGINMSFIRNIRSER